jgi:hypothetical protein
MSFVIKNTRSTASLTYDAGTYYQVDTYGLTKNLDEARIFPKLSSARQALYRHRDPEHEIVEVVIMETDTLVKKLAETLTNDQLRELNSLRSFKL